VAQRPSIDFALNPRGQHCAAAALAPDEGNLKPVASVLECPLFLVR
jgi:hypothetical protein